MVSKLAAWGAPDAIVARQTGPARVQSALNEQPKIAERRASDLSCDPENPRGGVWRERTAGDRTPHAREDPARTTTGIDSRPTRQRVRRGRPYATRGKLRATRVLTALRARICALRRDFWIFFHPLREESSAPDRSVADPSVGLDPQILYFPFDHSTRFQIPDQIPERRASPRGVVWVRVFGSSTGPALVQTSG